MFVSVCARNKDCLEKNETKQQRMILWNEMKLAQLYEKMTDYREVVNEKQSFSRRGY